MHLLRANTRRGSRKNIYAHYDLGNEFYKLWLDETMTYSSAIYNTPGESLEAAQRNKYQRIIDHLSKERDAHTLEIGCGWGGFAESACKQGVKVMGVTISKAQAEFAEQRLEQQKMEGKAQILISDYRDMQGKFDNIVSIEMFEAVGEKYWPSYFNTVRERLNEGGRAMIQTITVADKYFEHYRNRSDFIRKHIFPGGMLPSKEKFEEEAKKMGLKVQSAFAFGQDYAVTLDDWLQRFKAELKAIKEMGYPEMFIRKWEFYLAMCIGSFAGERTDVVQFELSHA
jgi:cyclopropane-fatty-acyl-phospholipid synthase